MHTGMRIQSNKTQKWQLARSISAEDKNFRANVSTVPAYELKTKAARGFRDIGVNFTKTDLDEYIASVLSGRDYRFVITF
ncbi:hypothetical protein BAQU_0441 [Bifidobacterium aquikefiri]|uniref:Uncharacterized protein n=2 Tax=Bifidobacterium aquikefiri TaxID=1653207 RepID=A0A261G8P1_9BIFI|nr:hypothetical protein BAQU_0441 [Bifidobacterium aquikefiri]